MKITPCFLQSISTFLTKFCFPQFKLKQDFSPPKLILHSELHGMIVVEGSKITAAISLSFSKIVLNESIFPKLNLFVRFM